MANTVTIKGKAVKYGLGTSTFPTTYGIVQSGSVATAAVLKDYRDEDGTICTTVVTDTEVKTGNFTVLLLSSSSLPQIGTELTIDSTKFIVENVSKDWANEDVQRATINVRYCPTEST